MRRALSLVLAVMLVSGHVAGLQLVAWTSMFVDRVQTQSVVEAVVSTLDGSAPCAMCRIATQLHQDDGLAAKTPLKVDKQVKKADGLPIWPELVTSPGPSQAKTCDPIIGAVLGRSIAPEPPPPRS